MGLVIDYYRPIPGKTYCQMLQSGRFHQWSADGLIWETPKYTGVQEMHGGSKAKFPKDGRDYLSFWGSTLGEPNTGGCCVSTYGGKTQHWKLAFKLFYFQGMFTFLNCYRRK